MDFQAHYAGLALILQAWGSGVAAFADDAAVDREVVAGLHHVADVVSARRTVCGDRSGANTISIPVASGIEMELYIERTYLGPVPPENIVVTPAASASSAC